MTYEDFCQKYNIDITENKFIDMRYIIKLALQKMRFPFNKLSPINYPVRPLLIEAVFSTKKGCGKYYKFITREINMKNRINLREDKWHQEINTRYSVQFWDNARRLCSSIRFDNPLKWLQYQILRNSLQTNYIVSHFIPNVSRECQFGCQENEKVSHIFWFCSRVTDFLNDVFNFVNNTGLNFQPTRDQFLFGFQNLHFSDPKNYLVLVLKKFIWTSKFKFGNLSFVGFKFYLKSVLSDLKVLYNLQKKENNFDVWNNLFNILCSD